MRVPSMGTAAKTSPHFVTTRALATVALIQLQIPAATVIHTVQQLATAAATIVNSVDLPQRLAHVVTTEAIAEGLVKASCACAIHTVHTLATAARTYSTVLTICLLLVCVYMLAFN